jgi:hypothetical protein
MSGLTFAFLVICVVLFAKLIQVYLQNRHHKGESDEDLERTLAKIDSLEERIQVLERIITESRFDLKRQIDGL